MVYHTFSNLLILQCSYTITFSQQSIFFENVHLVSFQGQFWSENFKGCSLLGRVILPGRRNSTIKSKLKPVRETDWMEYKMQGSKPQMMKLENQGRQHIVRGLV